VSKKQNRQGHLHRIFEQSARQGGSFTLRDTGISVDDILTDLDQHGAAYVLRKHKDVITPRDIDICLTIASQNMPERPEFQKNGLHAAVKILLDENVPYRIIPEILNEDSQLVHISFRKLTTKPDQTIWRFAKKQHFSALITNDNDFRRIAEMEALEQMSKTNDFSLARPSAVPLVVFIDAPDKNLKITGNLCKKNLRDIVALAGKAGRACIYATLDKDGLHEGPTAEDVYYKYIRPSITPGTRLPCPVFDRAILDHKNINIIRQNFGMPLMTFSSLPEWLEFHNTHYTPQVSQRQKRSSSPPSSDPAP
jgi:hypothetical protein